MNTMKKSVAVAGAAFCLVPLVGRAHSATMLPAYQMQHGEAAERANDWPLAEHYFREAIEMDYHNAAAHSELGLAYFHLGRIDRAAEEFEIALRLHPHLTSAENGLHLTFRTDADRDAYLGQIEAAVQSDPNDADARTTLAEELIDRNEYDHAKAEAQAAIKIDPDLGHAHCAMGRIEAHEGDDAAAHADLEIAVKKDRNDDDAWAALGDLATKSGDKQEAVNCYRHAVAAAPDHAEWHSKLAAALGAIGDSDGQAKEEAAALSGETGK